MQNLTINVVKNIDAQVTEEVATNVENTGSQRRWLITGGNKNFRPHYLPPGRKGDVIEVGAENIIQALGGERSFAVVEESNIDKDGVGNVRYEGKSFFLSSIFIWSSNPKIIIHNDRVEVDYGSGTPQTLVPVGNKVFHGKDGSMGTPLYSAAIDLVASVANAFGSGGSAVTAAPATQKEHWIRVGSGLLTLTSALHPYVENQLQALFASLPK